MTGSLQQVEIITRSLRRRWTDEQKLEMVRQSLAPGASVGLIAKRHGVAASQIYDWRKQALAGAMSGFVPVEVTDCAPMMAAPTGSAVAMDSNQSAQHPGLMEIDLPNGCRIRVGSDVDAGALGRALSAVQRVIKGMS